MEKLQGIDVIFDLYYRCVEGQCVVNDVLQGCFVYIIAKESLGNLESNLLERLLVDRVEETLRQLLDHLGHIKPTVGCKTLFYSLAERCFGGFMIGTVIFHISYFIAINLSMNSVR